MDGPKTLADIPNPQQFGDKEALFVAGGGPVLSYSDLHRVVVDVADQLRSWGLKPSTVVAVVVPNIVEFVAAFLGAVHARLVAAPMNPKYSAEEYKFYFEDSETAMVIVPPEGCASAETAAAELGLPVVEIGLYANGEISLTAKAQEKALGSESVPISPVVPDDVAMFLHTSGTTSKPKGVPLTHKNMATSIGNIMGHYKMTSDDRTLLVMPLFHVHGLMAALLSTLAAGGTVGMPNSGAFSASQFWKELAEVRATWFTAVPTIHQILLNRAEKEYPKDNPPQLRFIRSCSAALAPAVLERMEKLFGAPVVEAYAMTEAAHQMTSNPLPSAGPRKPGTVGRGTNVKVAILDSNNEQLPQGQVGEVCIQGDNVMAGYKNNLEATKAAWAGGWFHTGDQGFLDEDGYLTLTGRIKELINRGGEKISPVEVDAALLACPHVAEAVAFGQSHPIYGETVAAAVVLKAGAESTTVEDITDFLKERLAQFKIPSKLYIVDDLPRTATGKIQRRHVADRMLSQSQAGTATDTGDAQQPADGVVDGAQVVARTLAWAKITHAYGLVGVPVTMVATHMQKSGIRFLAFRNEQAAGYAAAGHGYLTGQPGVMLTVGGPGMINSIAGLSHAKENGCPMLLLSGSAPQALAGKGAFQDLDQMAAAAPYVKETIQAQNVSELPSKLLWGLKATMAGCPGPVYIDLPANLLHDTMRRTDLEDCLQSARPAWEEVTPHPIPSRDDLEKAANMLQTGRRPLLVIGKGAAQGQAAEALGRLVEATNLPFLTSPMGKGVLPDTHPQCVAAARSLALKKVDVVLVVGARLNWMFSFGEPPTWNPTAKFIIVNLDPVEAHAPKAALGLVGDAAQTVAALTSLLKPLDVAEWTAELYERRAANISKLEARLAAHCVPMDYYCALKVVREAIRGMDPPPVVVSEGANTMDYSRKILPMALPRQRLDAGTWGTMGVGLAYAAAAGALSQEVPGDGGRWVLAIEGDSAVGFSLAELETLVRYGLPVVVLVFNNGGVYGAPKSSAASATGGSAVKDYTQTDPAPTSFVPDVRYDKVMEALGGRGYNATDVATLELALREALSTRGASLINVHIDPMAGSESGSMAAYN